MTSTNNGMNHHSVAVNVLMSVVVFVLMG